MTLGERITKLRNAKGISQDTLALALGVSRQSVSKWETDASVPELDKLIKISEYFEISLDELVLDKVPVTTKLDELGAKVMTKENKQKAKKGVKVFGIIAGAVLAIDAISAIIYFLCWGFPK